MIRQYAQNIGAAGEALTAGYVVIQDTGTTMLADASGQATVAALTPTGIVVATAASGELPTVVDFGVADAIAGGNIARDEYVVAKAGAGTVIAYAVSDYSNNDKVNIVGKAMSAGTSGGRVSIFVDPFFFNVGK